jgi:beta-glucosidase
MRLRNCLLLIGLPFILSVSMLHAQASDSEVLKANELLGRMTAQEKIGQLNQLFVFAGAPPDRDRGGYEDRVRRGEIGSFLFVTDAKRIG